ncbi:MAG: hypothetical protein CSA74_12065 [Rhodobacterales bacterium]|nr:MAG: hypothetical protein CSA74_12065 [Rhodobacterales bacterium]
MTGTRKIPALSRFLLPLFLVSAATPVAADGLAFEPVAPEGLSSERMAGVKQFQASIGEDQLAAMKAEGQGAWGAIAIPVARRGDPVTVANLPDRAGARAAVLEACEAKAETGCAVIGFFVPGDG